ncbi:cytochrome c-type biogenesis protein CcmH [Hyphomonas sp.]|uniref:cytochrome c-type biogenesis protein n=1 Tax=Hyphomonas sp. TaxID=87 RepID=UPI00391D38BC
MKALLASLLIALAAETPLEDPAMEARAQALMREVRCVACENEPVSQSTAPIAEDMRVRIREMVADGATDSEIRAWFVSRYGEFVLFRPAARDPAGLLLWTLPFALLMAGLTAGIALAHRRRSGPAPEPVAPEEA